MCMYMYPLSSHSLLNGSLQLCCILSKRKENTLRARYRGASSRIFFLVKPISEQNEKRDKV